MLLTSLEVSWLTPDFSLADKSNAGEDYNQEMTVQVGETVQSPLRLNATNM